MRGQVWNSFPFIATSSGPSGHLPLKGKAFEGAVLTKGPEGFGAVLTAGISAVGRVFA